MRPEGRFPNAWEIPHFESRKRLKQKALLAGDEVF
jgi:hypothetical protein